MWIDFFNTLIEFSVVAEFFLLLSAHRKPKLFQIIAYSFISVFFSFLISFFHIHLLPVNFLMFMSALTILYYNKIILQGVTFGCAAFLCALYCEMTIDCLLPIYLLQTDIGNLIANLVMLLLTTFIWFICKKRASDEIISRLVWQHRISVLMMLLASTVIAQVYILQLSSFWIYLPGVIAVSLLLLVFVFLFVYIHYSKQAYLARSEMYQQNLDVAEKIIDSCRTEIHNHRSHIHHLADILYSNENLDDIRKQVDQYIGHLHDAREVPSKILGIEDPFYRTILYSCYSRCLEQGISFQLHISTMLPIFPMNDFELVEIIENLTVNAIEYVSSLDASHRSIKIALTSKGIDNTFSITNPFFEEKSSIDRYIQKGVSLKRGTHQGLGLSSVSEILSKYNIQLSYEVSGLATEITYSFTYSIQKD